VTTEADGTAEHAAETNVGNVAMSKLQELEETAAMMRRLGVTEFGNIKLGPAPQSAPKQLTGKEQLELARKREEAQRDILFAASHLKPSLKLVGK